MGEGREGEGLLCLSGGSLRQGGREEGDPGQSKPLKAKPCGPTKTSPGSQWLNCRQGWPWGGWEGVTGHSGARVMKNCLAEM